MTDDRSTPTSAASAPRCVYCLTSCGSLTNDHVFPEAWYPSDYPENLPKPTVPACKDCNKNHGRNEKLLLQRLGLHFGFDDPRAMGIGRKAARAIDPRAGSSKRDRAHRAAAHFALGRVLRKASDLDSETKVISGFGPHANPAVRSTIAVAIPPGAVRKFAEKLARGFTWHRRGTVLGEEFEFKTWNPNETQQAEIYQIMRGIVGNSPSGVDLLRLQPAITVCRASDPADPLPAFFIFEIWSATWKLFVEVRRRAEAEPTDENENQP